MAVARPISCTVANVAAAKQLPAEYLRSLGLADSRHGVEISYYDAGGIELAVKTRKRVSLKDEGNGPACVWPQGKPLATYGKWLRHPKHGYLILVEGESDCWTLWHHDFPALGVPGSNTANAIQREDLDGLNTVYVWREPDKGGAAFIAGVYLRLRKLGWQGQIRQVSLEGIKDPSVLHCVDPARFRERMLKAMDEAREINPQNAENLVRSSPAPQALPNGQSDGNGRTHAGGPAPNGHAGPESPRAEGDGGLWEQPIPVGEVPRAEPFPIDVLPAPLQNYVREVALSMNCPADFPGAFLLSLASGAIGNSRRLAIKGSHTQGAVLFVIAIGKASSGKSPALEAVTVPFETAEKALRAAWEDDMRQAEQDEATKKPILRRLLLDDTTTERMAEILAENPRGLVMVRDEASAIVAGMNQYKSGRGHDRQFYLKLWPQATIRVDRKGQIDKRPLVVYRPFASIVGGIPPSVVDSLRVTERSAAPLDDGFLDRFLFVYPEDLPAEGERWLEISPEAAQSWEHAVGRLLRLEMQREGDHERPFLLKLDADGRQVWQEFTDRHAAELNDPDFPEVLRSRWGKLYGYCGRLALVVECLHWSFTGVEPVYAVAPVRAASMRAAVRLIDYFKAHARKMVACLDADQRVAAAKVVLRCLAKRPDPRPESLRNQFPGQGFSRRDLYLLLRRHFSKPEALDAPLKLLAECRYVRLLPPEKNGKPGPAPERYETNPLWIEQTRAQRTQRAQDRPDETAAV